MRGSYCVNAVEELRDRQQSEDAARSKSDGLNRLAQPVHRVVVMSIRRHLGTPLTPTELRSSDADRHWDPSAITIPPHRYGPNAEFIFCLLASPVA